MSDKTQTSRMEDENMVVFENGCSLRTITECSDLIEKIIEQNGTYSAFHFDDDGDMFIYSCFPNIRKEEVNDFLYRSFNLYEYMLPSGIIAILARGAISSDHIFDVNLFDDDRLFRIADIENQNTFMILYDPQKDKVKAIRIVIFPTEVRNRLVEINRHNQALGYDSEKLREDAAKYLFSKSPQELKQDARYIGCEDRSIRPKRLVFVG